MKKNFIPLCLFLVLSAAGCSSLSVPAISMPSMPWSKPANQPNPTAEALFEEGTTSLNSQKYGRAIAAFGKIKTDYPFSPQLTEAELKMAEAYYLNKQYPEAVAAFKEFKDLHPTNEEIPFVTYSLGMAHYDQFGGIDRDPKMIETARGYFETVVKTYPSSPYASKSKEKLLQCVEYLAEHEFYIASFYMNQKKYAAARDRLEAILRLYRETPTAVKSLYQLGEAYRLDRNNIKAALAYEALIQYYPESPLAQDARAQLAVVEKEKQDPLRALLMREGRPNLALAQDSGGGPPSVADGQQNQRDVSFFIKKDVVHEEPGDDKGVFRRVVDTLNPFSSSPDKNDNGTSQKVAATQAANSAKGQPDGSGGSFWTALNPFAKSEQPKVQAVSDPQLLGKVDQSLKEKGITNGTLTILPTPPAADLPKEETPLPPTDTKALLGNVDTTLEKQGKDATGLPPLPEIAPVFKTATTPITTTTIDDSNQATAKANNQPSTSTTGLVSDIDQALRKKGIEPPKPETLSTAPEKPADASNRAQKVELDTKLVPEKGPLLLGTGAFQTQEKADESPEPKTEAPTQQSETPRELPQSVVKAPTQQQPKPPEPKVAEQKPSAEDDPANKGPIDQLKGTVGTIQKLLNPFDW